MEKVRTTCGAYVEPGLLRRAPTLSLGGALRLAGCPKPSCACERRGPGATGHGPASMTVTGTAVPSSAKTRVIPSLRPMSPLPSAHSTLISTSTPAGRSSFVSASIVWAGSRGCRAGACASAARTARGSSCPRAATAEHRPALHLHRKRDRSRHLRAGLLRRAHDVRRGLVEHLVVERLEPDANLACHGHSVFAHACSRRVPRPTVLVRVVGRRLS
jgi:hypothetical protein